MSEKMICKNCKYHYIEEISFDYPQSCCSKRKAVIEEWFKCNAFEYDDRYIEQLQQENQKLKDRDLIIAAELTKLQDENKQQKYNWNKLKSWADYMRVNTLQQNNYGRILDKMQELEQGSDSNVKD